MNEHPVDKQEELDEALREYSEITETSLLTKKQRQYLAGESDIEPKSPAERSARSRIRDRLSRGVADLSLLYDSMEGRDLKTAFEPFGPNSPWEKQLRTRNALAVILDGISKTAEDRETITEANLRSSDMTAFLEMEISIALRKLYERRGLPFKDVNVTIESYFAPTIEKLLQMSPDELSVEDCERLFEAGEITQNQFYRLVGVLSGKDPHEGEPLYDWNLE